jgi:nucleotide-binding universal stress UspA family protein
MITSLLVALDSSAYAKAALDHALELGRVYGARLTGLHVIDVRYLEMPPYLDYSYAFEAIPPPVVPADLLEKFEAKRDRILTHFATVAAEAGLSAESRSEDGVPGQMIAELGDAHDLVVMGKRGEHAKWGRDLLGPAAEAVARRSTRPILLTEEQYRPFRRAALFFDGSEPAFRVLGITSEIARRLGTELHVVTVDDDEEHGETVLQEARAQLQSQDLPCRYSVVPGKLPKAAATLLTAEPADLVAMGLRGHSPLRHLILGEAAEQLMRLVALPILLVP